jgi:hypothetical protein
VIYSKFDNTPDSKCVYCEGRFYTVEQAHQLPLTATWRPDGIFEDVEYAQCYVRGITLEEAAPPHLKERYVEAKKKMVTLVKSLEKVGVKPGVASMYHLFPEHHIKKLAQAESDIVKYTISNYAKPNNYEAVLGMYDVVKDIRRRPLNIVKTENNKEEYAEVMLQKARRRFKNRIDYKINGGKTGRLGLYKESFPILTLKRELRNTLGNNNGQLVEFDYNGADIRVAWALAGYEQPDGDMYNFINKRLGGKYTDRDEAKLDTFATLYAKGNNTSDISELLRVEDVLEKHFTGTHVTTTGGNLIEVDKDRAYSNLVQGCQADNFMQAVVNIHAYLKENKTRSYIAWLIHDCVVIDHDKDEDILDDIKEIFSNTPLGKFRVNYSAGSHYGEMGVIS